MFSKQSQYAPPKTWPVVGLCGGKQKDGGFFSAPGKTDPTVCIQFQLNARKVLQRMEIICCSRPELLKDKVFGTYVFGGFRGEPLALG